MKKEFVNVKILLVFALILFLSIIIVHAQQSPPFPDTPKIPVLGNINENTGQPEVVDQLSNKETRSDYLKKEWNKILKNNTFFGPLIGAYEKVQPILNPIFKYTVGVDLSVSWTFILAFISWVIILIYLQEIFSISSIFTEGSSWAISLALSVIIGFILKIPLKIANFIINTISIITIWWVQLIAVIAVVAILMLIAFIHQKFGNLIKALKKNKALREEKENREKLKEETKNISKYSKDISDAFSENE